MALLSCLFVARVIHVAQSHPYDAEFEQAQAFLARWGSAIQVVDYSTGGWEHIWDLLVPESALAEIPKHWLCGSEWADYP